MNGFAPYQVLQELGRGGMGVVYKAYDPRRREVVALKTLLHADPAALYRFKREFRSLADLALPHVVSLHELHSDGEQWFFSMEYVEGASFLEHVRPGDVLDVERLRAALARLAEGLVAVHRAGMLHRDLKPSNVLIGRDGRLVLLDFGLVAGLGDGGLHQSTQAGILGTVEYMSPEQALGGEISAASDWYSVGTMVYEALTGRLPFSGPPLQVLMAKQSEVPASPLALDPALPEDLARLAVDLLAISASERPSGRDVLERLAVGVGAPAPAPPDEEHVDLFGREREVAALEDALREAAEGRTVVVEVSGRSGVGKSALVEAFLAGAAKRRGAVVLSGRCYARESVPYKAVDSAVDSLARYLTHLPRVEAVALLPRDVQSLARVFPVLQRVEAIAEAPEHATGIPDALELRRRAFAALREMLLRTCDRHPLVLHVDDAHWGDADSVALLADVLRPPGAPPLLLLLSYRSEDRAGSAFLDGVRDLVERHGADLRHRAVVVDPLSTEDSRRLAAVLLGSDETAADAVAREAAGNPFFVRELVQSVRSGSHLGGRGDVTLDSVLMRRVEALEPSHRLLLEVVAISGMPLPEEVARAAAALADDAWGATAALRAGRFVRILGTDRGEMDTYHDKVREIVTAHVEPDVLRDRHRRLASALASHEGADPEHLAGHLLQGGDRAAAGRAYARAAERATAALAFDRAARLYRLSLEHQQPTGEERRAMLVPLAAALENARRGAEAAPVYLEAAGGAPEAEAFDLTCRAANQLLVSGRIEEWTRLAAPLLEALGLGRPRSARRVLLSLLRRRLWFRVRGYGFRERAAADIPARELLRQDTAWAVTTPLSYVDPLWAMELCSRSTVATLRTGEPVRVARALGGEAAISSAGGSKTTRRTWRIWQQARDLAQRTGDPYALASTSLMAGWVTLCEGRFAECVRHMETTEALLRERLTGVAWELNTAVFFRLQALDFLGRLREVAAGYPGALAEAEERGDLYAAINLRTRIGYVVHLLRDDPAAAADEVDRGIGSWPAEPFRIQHFFEMQARAEIAQYVGDPAEAWRFLERRARALERSHFLRIQAIRAVHTVLRARALHSLGETRLLERELRSLRREGAAWCAPFVPLYRDDPLAAAEAFTARGMAIHAASARRDENALRAAGIENPARWASMHYSPRTSGRPSTTGNQSPAPQSTQPAQ